MQVTGHCDKHAHNCGPEVHDNKKKDEVDPQKVQDEWDFPLRRGGMGEASAHRPKSKQ